MCVKYIKQMAKNVNMPGYIVTIELILTHQVIKLYLG